jgi:hypothetical protein
MRSLPHDDRRVREESAELYRVPVAARIRELLDELWDDPAFLAEVRERFEERSAHGEFPALREALSKLPEQARDEFLVQCWFDAVESLVPPRTQPWDAMGETVDSYRELLYSGMASLFAGTDYLPELAEEWLAELSRVGYRGMVPSPFHEPSISWRLPTKEQPYGSYSVVSDNLGAHTDAYAVVPEGSRQVLWLQLNGLRSSKRGYREVRVSDRPIRTDTAIVSALTALEGRAVDVEGLRESLERGDISLDESPYMQEPENDRLSPLGRDENPAGIDYVLLLLRYHRPDFGSLSREEKSGLIVHTCARINQFLEALRKLTSFLEYGTPTGQARAVTRDADMDVRAATLRDVVGLTYREIGEELDVPPPKDFEIKGDYPRVRQMVIRGRKILVLALGEDGWRRHIEAMKAEAKRWNSLSEVERDVEDWVEYGLPYEEALRMATYDDELRKN